MNIFIWISFIFVHSYYTLAPQQHPDMMSILQELESHLSIKSFPQDKIATLQIIELRKEHHIHPQTPIFSTKFFKTIKSMTAQCENNFDQFKPPSLITPHDATRIPELCQTLIDRASKLEQDPHNDILAFYLKRTLDSMIYIATPYNCYEARVYKKIFKTLLVYIQKHPFWSEVKPLKNTEPLTHRSQSKRKL